MKNKTGFESTHDKRKCDSDWSAEIGFNLWYAFWGGNINMTRDTNFSDISKFSLDQDFGFDRPSIKSLSHVSNPCVKSVSWRI